MECVNGITRLECSGIGVPTLAVEIVSIADLEEGFLFVCKYIGLSKCFLISNWQTK